jgi:hypothetical protein
MEKGWPFASVRSKTVPSRRGGRSPLAATGTERAAATEAASRKQDARSGRGFAGAGRTDLLIRCGVEDDETL